MISKKHFDAAIKYLASLLQGSEQDIQDSLDLINANVNSILARLDEIEDEIKYRK